MSWSVIREFRPWQIPQPRSDAGRYSIYLPRRDERLSWTYLNADYKLLSESYYKSNLSTELINLRHVLVGCHGYRRKRARGR